MQKDFIEPENKMISKLIKLIILVRIRLKVIIGILRYVTMRGSVMMFYANYHEIVQCVDFLSTLLSVGFNLVFTVDGVLVNGLKV